MTQHSIFVYGTGTDGPVAFDLVTGTGTASDIAFQQVKIVGATGNGLTINTAGAAQVQQMTSATIPVSVSSAATLPITGSVSVSSAATLAITGVVGLGVSATVPVSVSSAATLPVVITSAVPLGVSATIPVSVSTAATHAVVVTNLATLLKAEDSGHTSGDTGIFILGVRNDNGTSIVDTDLDYGPFRVNSAGNVITQGRGFISHNATADSNPMQVGGYAYTATDAIVADQVVVDDVTHWRMNRDGAGYVLPYPPRIWDAGFEVVAPATDTSVKTSTATGHSLYVTSIFCGVNDGCAPHLTKGTGTASMIWKHYFATRGDGYAQQWNPPIKLPATTDLLISSTATSTFFLRVTGYTAP